MRFHELKISELINLYEHHYDLFSGIIDLCLAEDIGPINEANKKCIQNITHLTKYKFEQIATTRSLNALDDARDDRIRSQGGT